MGRYIAKNPRGNARCAWMWEPWTCPKCSRTINAGGQGSHKTNCGADLEARFWAKIEKEGHGGCWIWTAGMDKWGYGDLRWYGNKHVQAHRLAWRLLRGDPGKLDCLHTCHNPSCCNPDHLYLGTDVENGRDRVVAGRSLRGEDVPTSKLTAADVLEIRSLRGKELAKSIAARFGVNASHISNLWTRRLWKHLP